MLLFWLQIRQVKKYINQLQLECYIFHTKYFSFYLVAYSSAWLIKLQAIVVLPGTIRSFYAVVFSKSSFFVKNSCYVLGLSEFKDKPRRSALRKPFSSMSLSTDCRIGNISKTAGCIWKVTLTHFLSSSHYSWFLYLCFLSLYLSVF